MTPQPSPLFKLPSEILTGILANLSLHGLVTCKQTCKKLKELYDSSSQLQYIAELEIAGMIDNPYCSMNVAERLEMLRKREDAWAALQPGFSTTIPIPKPAAGIYDVTPNNYLLGVAAGPFQQLTLGIQSMALPSYPNEALASPPVFINLAKHIIDFGTSIEEHDLLAAVTIASTPNNRLFSLEITLFRHSTGTLHDEAEKPVIEVTQVDTDVSISIEISGENLALIVNARGGGIPNELHIFNWKKGTRKGDPMPSPNLGLCYLREDLFLVPDVETLTLTVMHITHSIPGVDDKDLPITPIIQFGLPPLAPGQRVARIECRCDPSPTAGNKYPRYSPKNRPFSNDPQCAIMIIEMTFWGARRPRVYNAFMHRGALLDLLPEGWESTLVLPTPKGKEPALSTQRASESIDEGSPIDERPASEGLSNTFVQPPGPSTSTSQPASTQLSDSLPENQEAREDSTPEPTNAGGTEGHQASYNDEAVVALLDQNHDDDDDDDGDGEYMDDGEDDGEHIDDGEDDGDYMGDGDYDGDYMGDGDYDGDYMGDGDYELLIVEEDAEDLPSAQELGLLLDNEPLVWHTAPDGSMHAILDQEIDFSPPSGGLVPPSVPWSEWGPKTTRWLDSAKYVSVYITSTAGQRFVCIDKESRPRNSPIRMLDFNPYHVRKAHLSKEIYPCTDRLVGVGPEELQDHSEKCPAGGVWAEDIVSRLPYIESSTETYYGYVAVLLDEQRIIGLIGSDGGFIDVNKIAVLHYG